MYISLRNLYFTEQIISIEKQTPFTNFDKKYIPDNNYNSKSGTLKKQPQVLETWFDGDFFQTKVKQIQRIHNLTLIFDSQQIFGYRVIYQLKDGSLVEIERIPPMIDSIQEGLIRFKQNEFISRISGSLYKNYISSLNIETNIGRSLQFGGEKGQNFHIQTENNENLLIFGGMMSAYTYQKLIVETFKKKRFIIPEVVSYDGLIQFDDQELFENIDNVLKIQAMKFFYTKNDILGYQCNYLTVKMEIIKACRYQKQISNRKELSKMFSFAEDEYINQIKIYSSKFINGLQFITNKRQHPIIGSTKGKAFVMKANSNQHFALFGGQIHRSEGQDKMLEIIARARSIDKIIVNI